MTNRYDLSVTPANELRRPEYACDDDWIRQFLIQAEIGHIGSRWEGQPFVTPVLFWYDAQNHQIYFHTNITGRLRANIERHEQVCLEACKMGRVLPANTALEFALQFESAVVFGECQLVEDDEEKRRTLYGLIGKYFPTMTPGKEYRPITDGELKRTAVYAISIQSWSGKRNWKARADQSPDWPALGPEWFAAND